MWSQIPPRYHFGPALLFQPSAGASRAANVFGMDFGFSDCLDIMNASSLRQQQDIHGILVAVNQYLPHRFQRVSSTRYTACMGALCIGCPQVHSPSARHKGIARRGHCAWQHILKARERQLFLVVTIIVSWVPLTQECCVFQTSLSTNACHHQSSVSCHFEMAEVSSAHDGAIIAMLDAGGCTLREIDIVAFVPPVACVGMAATLSL